MNTINASSRLTHFHQHRGRDGHDHVRAYDRVHVYDHDCARVHRLHDNVHDVLCLKAV